MSINDRILIPLLNIGDHVYTKGHGNRKSCEKWDVVYLGYNGATWFINIVLYHGKEFIKSAQIDAAWLNDGIYYTDESLVK